MWELVEDPLFTRTFSDNCIYAIGGFDSTNYQASVEKWVLHLSPSMQTKMNEIQIKTDQDPWVYDDLRVYLQENRQSVF